MQDATAGRRGRRWGEVMEGQRLWFESRLPTSLRLPLGGPQNLLETVSSPAKAGWHDLRGLWWNSREILCVEAFCAVLSVRPLLSLGSYRVCLVLRLSLTLNRSTAVSASPPWVGAMLEKLLRWGGGTPSPEQRAVTVHTHTHTHFCYASQTPFYKN